MSRRQRGSVTVEMAILTPAFLLLVVLAVVAGRTEVARSAVDLAAHDAARAASISRDADSAATAAVSAAASTLEQQGLHCVNDLTTDISVDTGGFAEPTGPGLAFVDVTVVCEVSFADVALPGVPATHTVSATFASPLDVFRGRS